jgi:cytochrome c-type biogenesis protein CcsB
MLDYLLSAVNGLLLLLTSYPAPEAVQDHSVLNAGATLFKLATYGYFGAYFLYAVHTLLYRARWVGVLATALLLAGWVAHLGFFVQRAKFYYEQHGGFLLPATNMYEAIGFFAWLIVALYLISERVLKTRQFALIALAVPAVAMAYTGEAMSADPRELFPSLKSYWLVYHISAMFISYALFFMAFVFGLLYVLRAWGTRAIAWLDQRFDLAYLDTMSSRFIRIGVPVLSLGIGLGAVWANAAWGRPWGWDPKETWALITWFVYIIYLHFRSYAWFNAYRAALTSMIGFVVVLVTFQGVNLLDSYFNTNSIHAYAEGGNPAVMLGILTALLLVPIALLFLPIPPAALAHRRVEAEPERDVRRDKVPLPKQLGGGSGEPGITGAQAPQHKQEDADSYSL